MIVMASKITRETSHSDNKETIPTSGFLPQRASYVENFSMPYRHHAWSCPTRKLLSLKVDREDIVWIVHCDLKCSISVIGQLYWSSPMIWLHHKGQSTESISRINYCKFGSKYVNKIPRHASSSPNSRVRLIPKTQLHTSENDLRNSYKYTLRFRSHFSGLVMPLSAIASTDLMNIHDCGHNW